MKFPKVVLFIGAILMMTANIAFAKGQSCKKYYACDDTEICWNGACVTKDHFPKRRHQFNNDYYGNYKRSASSGTSGYFKKTSRSGTTGRRNTDGYVRHETVSKKVSGSRYR